MTLRLDHRRSHTIYEPDHIEAIAIAISPINLVLMGPPGSGKGTQAARICRRYGLVAISTGDILRAAVRSGSQLGQQVGKVLAAGNLVDDEVIVDLVRERLAQPDVSAGFVLDGFPRTVAQAEALDRLQAGTPVHVIALDVPDAELERRLDSRRICLNCRTVYTGGTRHGSEEELCSRCGVALIKRDDDNLKTIRNRLRVYRAATAPLLRYYGDRSSLTMIDGRNEPDVVAGAIIDVIDGLRAQGE